MVVGHDADVCPLMSGLQSKTNRNGIVFSYKTGAEASIPKSTSLLPLVRAHMMEYAVWVRPTEEGGRDEILHFNAADLDGDGVCVVSSSPPAIFALSIVDISTVVSCGL